MKARRYALIDGDIAAFRAAAVTKKDLDWDTEEEIPLAPLPVGEAIQTAIWTINAWTKLAGMASPIVAFTGPNNFRKTVLPSYKANRAGKSKPETYNDVVEALKAEFRCEEVPNLEGDDLLGIMMTTKGWEDCVTVTLDKDLRTVPGWHLNPIKETKPVQVTPEQAVYWWMTQVLTGDTSDGYVGCPGIGPVKARQCLGEIGGTEADYWPNVVALYESRGLTEEDALVQARVSRILHRCDYDKRTKEIKLWEALKTCSAG